MYSPTALSSADPATIVAVPDHGAELVGLLVSIFVLGVLADSIRRR